MRTITLFKQQRQDGGTRSGIDIDGELLLQRFVRGAEEDPALLWYVDIRCTGEYLPADGEDARDWLVRHTTALALGLKELAAKISAGVDVDIWPVTHALPPLPDGTSILVVASAMRRLAGRELARHVQGLADTLTDELRSLAPMQPLLH